MWSEMITELFRVQQINSIEIYHEETPEGGMRKYEELLMSNRKPNLVLLDYRFGGKVNGGNVAKWIIELDKSANIYVFTFYPTLDIIEEMAKIGVSNFLSKLDSSEVLIGELIEICTEMKKEHPNITLNA